MRLSEFQNVTLAYSVSYAHLRLDLRRGKVMINDLQIQTAPEYKTYKDRQNRFSYFSSNKL